MKYECVTSEQMASLVNGIIAPDEQDRLLRHVAQCDACYEEYVAMLSLDELEDALSGKLEEGFHGRSDNPTDILPFIAPLISPDEVPLAWDDPLSVTHPVQLAAGGDGPSDSTAGTDVRQLYPDTCAIKAQQIILKDFGINVSESILREESIEKGWYTPSTSFHKGGTQLHDVGKLLEAHGIHVQQHYGTDVHALVDELSHGHEVIIEVDAGMLHHPGAAEQLKDMFMGPTPNHAVIVAGIDTSNASDIKVFLKDPGTGDTAKEYSLGDFMNAWKDSGFFMVSTTDPIPNLQNFDYLKGHIDAVDHHVYSSPHRDDHDVSGLSADHPQHYHKDDHDDHVDHDHNDHNENDFI